MYMYIHVRMFASSISVYCKLVDCLHCMVYAGTKFSGFAFGKDLLHMIIIGAIIILSVK